jgi:uncharacterized protein (TIGR03086 family)
LLARGDASPVDTSALLGRAVDYTRGSLSHVTSALLSAPTPCSEWNLEALLRHMDDSLLAFTEAADVGYVDLGPVVPDDPAAELVGHLRARACALLAAWTHHPPTGMLAVADLALPAGLVAAAGALEITAHGWDVARACRVHHPIPAALAVALMSVVPQVVHDTDRPHRFADPVDVPPAARPGARLLGLIGRVSD